MIKKNISCKNIVGISLLAIFLGILPLHAMQGDGEQPKSPDTSEQIELSRLQKIWSFLTEGDGNSELSTWQEIRASIAADFPRSPISVEELAARFGNLWSGVKHFVTTLPSAATGCMPCLGEREAQEQTFRCQICNQDIFPGECRFTVPCSHPFHKYCIEHWTSFQAQCPVCDVAIERLEENAASQAVLHMEAPANHPHGD